MRSPDSDILFILLHYAEQLKPLVIYFDTGTGAKRRWINISNLAKTLTPRYCEFLLGIHCYTGEDSNCAFKGKGKVRPVKEACQNQKYMDTFIKLGTEWSLDEDTHTELEEFTCAIYGQNRSKSVNKVHASLIKKATGGNTSSINKVKKVDLAKMPPCQRSLKPHARRVNFRVAQFK